MATTAKVNIPLIKQGDAGYMGVTLAIGDETVTAADLGLFHCIEFMIGDGIRKLWPNEAIFAEGMFHVPYEQEETFALEEGEKVNVDVRVHFETNNDNEQVIGIHAFPRLKVVDAISEVTLN